MDLDLLVWLGLSLLVLLTTFLACHPACTRCLPLLCGAECCCRRCTKASEIPSADAEGPRRGCPRDLLVKVPVRALVSLAVGYAMAALLIVVYASTFDPFPGTPAGICQDTCVPNAPQCCSYRDPLVPYENVTFESAGQQMHGWWIPSHNGSVLTVLYSHGSGHNLAVRYRQERYRFLRDLGLNVFTYDYPGYGRSAGVATEASVMQCARDALGYAAQRTRQPASDVLLLGRSLGAAVAVRLAFEAQGSGSGVRGLVLQSAWASYRRTAGLYAGRVLAWAVEAIWAPEFASVELIGEVETCVYQYHSRADEWVQYAEAVQLHRAAKRARRACSVWVEEDAALHDSPLSSAQQSSLRKFVSRMPS